MNRTLHDAAEHRRAIHLLRYIQPRCGFADKGEFTVGRVDAKFGPIENKKRSRIQKLSGANLHRNWISIPHVTQFDAADITELEAFRKSNTAETEKRGFKLTMLAFLIKASVTALKQYPQFNAALEKSGENLIIRRYYHIGVAVDTPDGLVVPVIRDADRKGVFDLAKELADISKLARDKKLKPGDMQGGGYRYAPSPWR